MTDEELLQFLVDKLNEGYEEYKRNHPDIAIGQKKEERKLKGNYGRRRSHCETCGEWLEGFDQCSQCGRVNK